MDQADRILINAEGTDITFSRSNHLHYIPVGTSVTFADPRGNSDKPSRADDVGQGGELPLTVPPPLDLPREPISLGEGIILGASVGILIALFVVGLAYLTKTGLFQRNEWRQQ